MSDGDSSDDVDLPVRRHASMWLRRAPGTQRGTRPPRVSNVMVSNDTAAPTVAITSPSAGATVLGAVAVTASASDNVGVARVLSQGPQVDQWQFARLLRKLALTLDGLGLTDVRLIGPDTAATWDRRHLPHAGNDCRQYRHVEGGSFRPPQLRRQFLVEPTMRSRAPRSTRNFWMTEVSNIGGRALAPQAGPAGHTGAELRRAVGASLVFGALARLLCRQHRGRLRGQTVHGRLGPVHPAGTLAYAAAEAEREQQTTDSEEDQRFGHLPRNARHRGEESENVGLHDDSPDLIPDLRKERTCGAVATEFAPISGVSVVTPKQPLEFCLNDFRHHQSRRGRGRCCGPHEGFDVGGAEVTVVSKPRAIAQPWSDATDQG